MRKNNCEIIRRELDELMLNEACNASVAEHLKHCSACREFHQTQTKLRQMVGSLGTVAAPADFDSRLRARLANEVGSKGFHYWTFARKGLAFAAVLVVFATGIVVVRNVWNQPTGNPVVAGGNPPPAQQQSPRPDTTTTSNASASVNQFNTGVQETSRGKIRNERREQTGPKMKRSLTAVEFASQRAEVISGSEAIGSEATAVIPIDASLPSLKFSLDDGSGNARTISVPTIRFGSQRMLPNGNQFAQKGIW